MSITCRPECKIKRKIKKAMKTIEPKPFFHSQWIWETVQEPDPLIKVKALVKDLDFLQSHRFDGFYFQSDYVKLAKLRMREELEPLLLKEEKQREKEIQESNQT